MDVIHTHCAGLDVHKEAVVVTVIALDPKGRLIKETRSFETMTARLLALSDWLIEHSVTHVAMESTGVYWKPVFNILEDSMQIILANARHIKNVPGRKTDVKDCEWIAQLLRHGLIKGSFIPPRPIRELRDLTRYRRKLIQQRSSELNRIQKFLEDANIKLSSVVTDINGVSAQDMIYR